MSKFISFFPLFEQSQYLGLSADPQSGTVIYTLDQNIVYRIELSNQQQIQSWTFKTKLSHKVVYDFKSDKYVGVFENAYIKSWGQEDGTKKEKFKLPGPLEEIISFDGKYTILVYKDGTCESFENLSNVRRPVSTPIVNEQTHQMLNIACFNSRDNYVILTYFLRNKLTGDMEFVFFQLHHETLTQTGSINKINISRTGATLSAFTVVEGDIPNLMTIWSDKRIFMLPIDEYATSDDQKFVAMFDCLKVDKPLTIVNVSKNWVAVYGGNLQQDGASLVLYNTRYHVVQCRQFFKVYLNNCRLNMIGKYIFIAVGQNVSCAEVRLTQERLSDLIGSKRSTELNGIVDKDSINEESELEECVSFNEFGQTSNSMTQSKQQPKKVKETNQNLKKQPTEMIESHFSDLRSLYVHGISIDIINSDSLLSKLVQTRPAVNVEDRLYSSPTIGLMTDCLEKDGRSETEIAEHVVPQLIKANSPNELVVCLRKYTNISDRMLVKSLKYFISMEESNEKWTYINFVLSCSFNEELIKEHLRTNLNLENAIDLLKYLHSCILSEDKILTSSPQFGDEFDQHTLLINWFVVILEAHYQQFILARDLTFSNLIMEWKETIASLITDIRGFKPLIATLQHLLQGKTKPKENSSSKRYSVEMVKLY